MLAFRIQNESDKKMLFPDAKRLVYKKNTVKTVICQLRFPPILSIDSQPPADFQDAIRKEFPNYEEVPEYQHEVSFGVDMGNPLRQLSPIANVSVMKNYSFLSKDKSWKVSLTRSFVALSTTKYGVWSTFYKKLQKTISALEKIYKPSYISRVGLRYINVFDRKALGVENTPWHRLLSSNILGFCSLDDSQDVQGYKSTSDILFPQLGCKARVTSALARQNQDVKNLSFILDTDLYFDKQIEIKLIKNNLDILHKTSRNILEFSIRDELRSCMEQK